MTDYHSTRSTTVQLLDFIRRSPPGKHMGVRHSNRGGGVVVSARNEPAIPFHAREKSPDRPALSITAKRHPFCVSRSRRNLYEAAIFFLLLVALDVAWISVLRQTATQVLIFFLSHPEVDIGLTRAILW
jgi:hypothetical protein